jgi:hypothetical protein
MTDIFLEFRKDSGIVYPPFSQEYFERYFYRYIQRHPGLLKKYIPVFWTEIMNSSYDARKLQVILDNMDYRQKYFTIVQHDDGIRERLTNTIVFGMGGVGTIPLPLTYENPELFAKYTGRPKTIFCSFVGSSTHPCRVAAANAVIGKPGVVCSMNQWTNQLGKDKQEYFLDITSQSKFVLAPRGYGKTSFRMYEAFNMGCVPVYVYDTLWLPYTELLDWNKLAVLVHVKDANSLYDRLKAITDDEYTAMLQYYKENARLFTYDGMCDYIVSKVIS